MNSHDSSVVIIGAGPAGLTAAYRLAGRGIPCTVLEKDPQVGGLSRTVDHRGYLFDIGGHRFFTKSARVKQMWREVLDEEDFPSCSRLSRIYYRKRFFDYPLRPASTLKGLGLAESAGILLSYLHSRLRPQRPERTFEQWVSNRMGRRLYRTFFQTYTEKVWGMSGQEISADWAAQRIKDFSLPRAVRNALFGARRTSRGSPIRTLVDRFRYPRRGPGMMWERVADRVRDGGGRILLNAEVEGIVHRRGRVEGLRVRTGQGREILRGTDFISTMPVRELIGSLTPSPPRAVALAARRLRYRDFLTVALVVKRREVFPDNWIYIHDPGLRVGRIQNFKNWSPEMVPDPERTCLGLEYFCFRGDGLWSMPDEELVGLATRELKSLGFISGAEVEGGTVVRMPQAYPVYDSAYAAALETIRGFVGRLENLQLVGRNGMHRYNNQDHSMLTAMLAVENLGGADHDLWCVNSDAEYHEGSRPADPGGDELRRLWPTQPRVPSLADG